MKKYIVVENAGYEKECDIREFKNYTEAVKWMESYYEKDELESLHVEICVERDGERSYEI
jgi:hypothetical protein